MAGYWTYLQDTIEIFYYHACRNYTIKDVQFLNDFGGTWGDPDYCQSLGFYTTCVLLNSLDILHTLHMYFNTYTAGLMLDKMLFLWLFFSRGLCPFSFCWYYWNRMLSSTFHTPTLNTHLPIWLQRLEYRVHLGKLELLCKVAV